MKKEILRLEHIYIKKAGRQVLNDFSMNVFEDEFLFVYGFSDSGTRELGELMAGTRKVDRGRILIDDKNAAAASYASPGDAGIYIIQNKNNLVEDFSIAENLFFGGKKKYFQRVVPAKKQELMARSLIKEFNFEIDVRRTARNLSFFQEIMIKMIMAYVRGARLVVFNEIVGFEGFKDEKRLFSDAVKKLRDEGISVLWINQKMDEITEQADRIIVLEDGRNTRTLYKGSSRESEVIKNTFLDKMMNRIDYETNLIAKKSSIHVDSEVLFKADDICSRFISNFSLEVHKGEMIYITSDNNEKLHVLREILTGEKQDYTGSMLMCGKEYKPKNNLEAVDRGVGCLDLLWYENHCVPEMNVADNILLDSYWKRCRMFGVINKSKHQHMMNLYKMHHPGWPTDHFRSLSADQQKIMLLEKMVYEPYRLLIIIQPFVQLHGLMKGVFHNLLLELKKTNDAIILMAMGDKHCAEISDTVVML